MIICNTLFSSCASIYSTLLVATPPPPLSNRPLPSFLADLASRNPPCRPLYVHVHPLITSYPAHLPGPQSSNYIHSALRLSGSRGSNSVHLSLRTDCDSSDRTSCVFLFLPLSRSPPSVSSHLCLVRQAPVSAFGDRTVLHLSLSLSLSLTPDIRSSSSRCMYDPRWLPDGSGISEFPRACWAPAVWSWRREKD